VGPVRGAAHPYLHRVLPSDTPETESLDAIRDLERRRLRALVAADLDLAQSIHADDYQLITPGGRTLTRDEYLGGVASGDLDYVVFEAASEIAVRINGQMAVVRYQARIEMRFSGQRDTGLFWHTDIYEQRDGRWQAVWSQATRIRPPEPEG
jgi:phage baseplate assembly protein W